MHTHKKKTLQQFMRQLRMGNCGIPT